MPFTPADLAAIDQAIASGELRVRFQDGRQVEYRSMRELKESKTLIQGELIEDSGIRRPQSFRINTRKGI